MHVMYIRKGQNLEGSVRHTLAGQSAMLAVSTGGPQPAAYAPARLRSEARRKRRQGVELGDRLGACTAEGLARQSQAKPLGSSAHNMCRRRTRLRFGTLPAMCPSAQSRRCISCRPALPAALLVITPHGGGGATRTAQAARGRAAPPGDSN